MRNTSPSQPGLAEEDQTVASAWNTHRYSLPFVSGKTSLELPSCLFKSSARPQSITFFLKNEVFCYARPADRHLKNILAVDEV